MADDFIRIDPSRLTPRGILLSLAVNAVVNTVIAVILTAIGFGRGFAVNLIFSQCIGNSIYLANLAAIPVYRRAKSLPAQIAIIVLSIISGAVIGVVIGAAANGMGPGVFLREQSTLFGQVVLLALLFGFVVSYVYISASVISGDKVRRIETEKNAVEAELRLYQSQMEPHFLFNTLSNVLGLIDSDRDKARRMLESFTSFLRFSIATARERTVSLDQEMDIVRKYLDVFSVRMGERLRFDTSVPADLKSIRIPPLTIQPLVENAVKHGLEPKVEGGAISIKAERDGGKVRITVADTGIGVSEKNAGSGIGLENIRKRLNLRYAERGRLLFEENEPSGVKVTIEIPYER
ncbi:MAG TPA: histidine kinase [Nitrospirota bacterium]|nr:histidine kinase [Nitrospirota bacterium]